MKAIILQAIVTLILFGQGQGQALATDVRVGIDERITDYSIEELDGVEVKKPDGSSLRIRHMKKTQLSDKHASGSANIHTRPGGGAVLSSLTERSCRPVTSL